VSVRVTVTGKVVPFSALVGVIVRVDVVALYHESAGDKDIVTVSFYKSVILGSANPHFHPIYTVVLPGLESNVGAVLVEAA
jgi:hypothetical protein